MSNITILRPVWSGASTAKTFALDKDTGKIKTKSSYDLGKLFKHATTTVNNASELYGLLKKCEDKKAFRIYGRPVPGLPQPARRLKENFTCDETNLVLIDADSWPVPEGHSILTKEDLAKTVTNMLVDKMKLSAFKDVQFVCMLSSSAWTKTHLRAHLYFLLDEPVELEALHKWGYEHNKLNPEYKIDYSLFRQVQPDYISKRICLDFQDNLLSKVRLTLHCDHLSPYVRKADLLEHFKTATAALGVDPYASVGVQSSSHVPIGSSWEKTIEMAGSAELGINEPTYRACAQLVQEVGDQEVTDNLVYHINKVFTKMWAAIRKHGVRGDHTDKDLYTREKIKGYLTTAVAKKFGEQADKDTKEITDAIAAIKAGATASVIFTKPCLEAIQNIKISSPEKWANIRSIIKRDLRGLVAVGDLEKAAGTAAKEKYDLELVLEDVVDKFKWYIGKSDNSMYCMREHDQGYSLKSIADGVENDMYGVLFGMMGNNMPRGFDKDIIRLIVIRKDDYRNPFEVAPVENRSYTELVDNKHITYFNMGSTIDQPMQTAVIDENGVRVIPSITAPVLWKDTTNTLVAPVSTDALEFEPGIMGEMQEGWLIEEYLDGLRKFTTVSDDLDLVEVVAWQTTAVVNTGTAQLLQITGASNCGKSSTAGFVKDLVDPTSSNLRDSPDLHSRLYKDKELAKTLRGRHVTIFDNLNKLSDDEQNNLCVLATGWQYDYRVLYSEQMESIRLKKPLILTSLNPIVSNQDLRSRTISVLTDDSMKSEEGDLFELWKKRSPRIRAGMLLFVSKVIRRINRLRKEGKSVNDRKLWGVHAKIEATLRMNLSPGFELLSDEDQEEMVLNRQVSDEVSEALQDSWVALLAAWVTESKLFAVPKVVKVIPQDLFGDFKEFVSENAGTKVKVCGIGIEIEAYDIPRNVKQFGTKLGRCVQDVYEITGWRVKSTRTSGQRFWRFSPTEKLSQRRAGK